jgi:hypothetical protein
MDDHPNKIMSSRSYTPFLNVFSMTDQTIPPNGAVEFDDFGEIRGFKHSRTGAITALTGGVYQFYYYLLPLFGTPNTPNSTAFGIQVNGHVQSQTRAGIGFQSLQNLTTPSLELWGLLTLPPKAKIYLVNVSSDPITLLGDLVTVSPTTASLTLKRLSNPRSDAMNREEG